MLVCRHPSRLLLPPSSPRTVSGIDALINASVRADQPLYPRGPRSGPGYVVPIHPHLIGPIRPGGRHIPISPSRGLYGMPSLCMLELNMPRQPTTGSELSLMLFCNMSPSETPGNSSAAFAQYLTEDTSLQLRITVFGIPKHPHTPILVRAQLRGFTTGVRLRYDLLRC